MNGSWEEHHIDVSNRLEGLETGMGEMRTELAKVMPSITVLQARMAFIGAAAAIIVTLIIWFASQLVSVGSPAPVIGEGCSESYPDFCIAQAPPDLDCSDLRHSNFTVLQPDPHGFDGDQNGIGCET